MITLRIIRNIFSGEYGSRKLSCHGTVMDLRVETGLAASPIFRDGVRLEDTDRLYDGDLVIAVNVPKGDPVSITIAIGLGLVLAIGGTMTLLNAMKVPSVRKLQTSPSLRGSANAARKEQMLPILLGKHRIYPDAAALPYTLYRSNDQYLRQLYSFGYSSVSIDMTTLKIGETLITKYTDYSIPSDFSDIYPQRCIESAIGTELKKGVSIERTTASGTWKISVGIIAPSGIYRSEGDDGTSEASVGIRIEYRESGTGAWTAAADETLHLNTTKFRKSYEITPPSSGTFDVRVTRTNTESEDSAVVDTVYLDVIQSWTESADGSRSPVIGSSRFRLLAVELKATDQLNGIIDEFNAVCTLRARVYSGTGTGPEAWKEGDAVNPASAILYLLTDPYANPHPLSDSEIVWDEFEDFYAYCEDHGFQCNAYINSQDYSIEEICSYIAESNLAQIRMAGSRIGIIIDEASEHITQLFTPRNAWDFSMQRSFSSSVRYFRLKYVDASLGYVETERVLSLSPDGTIVFDAEIPERESGTEISLLGVTDADQAAYIGRQKLREIAWRRRTFTWTSDIEGILCAPGDVVRMEHDQFSIGLGEGRIRKINLFASGTVESIELDAALPFQEGGSYGAVIRSASGISGSIPVFPEDDGRTLRLKDAAEPDAFSIGDLCAVGEYTKETIRLMITSLQRDQDNACRITAVDYSPEIYEEGEIPPYNPGISRYPDAGEIGTGAHLPEGYIPPGKPGSPGASSYLHIAYSDSADGSVNFNFTSGSFIGIYSDSSPSASLDPSDYVWTALEGRAPLIQYAYGDSSTEPPFSRLFAFFCDSLITVDGMPVVDLSGDWTSGTPVPEDGKPYLWIRISTDGGKTWVYNLFREQGQDGKPAIDFRIDGKMETFYLSSRGYVIEEQVIDYSITKFNTTLPITWDWSPKGNDYISFRTWKDEAGTEKLTVTLKPGLSIQSFTIYATMEGVGTRAKEIPGTRVGVREPMYCGLRTSFPADSVIATTQGPFMEGDYILFYSASGEKIPFWWAGESPEQPPMSKDELIGLGELPAGASDQDYASYSQYQWRLVDREYTPNYSQIVTGTSADSVTGKLSSLSATWGYFRDVFTSNLVTDFLQAFEYELRNGGSLHSEGYRKGDVNRLEREGFWFDTSGYSEVISMIARNIFARGKFVADAFETFDDIPEITKDSLAGEYQDYWQNNSCLTDDFTLTTLHSGADYDRLFFSEYYAFMLSSSGSIRVKDLARDYYGATLSRIVDEGGYSPVWKTGCFGRTAGILYGDISYGGGGIHTRFTVDSSGTVTQGMTGLTSYRFADAAYGNGWFLLAGASVSYSISETIRENDTNTLSGVTGTAVRFIGNAFIVFTPGASNLSRILLDDSGALKSNETYSLPSGKTIQDIAYGEGKWCIAASDRSAIIVSDLSALSSASAIPDAFPALPQSITFHGGLIAAAFGTSGYGIYKASDDGSSISALKEGSDYQPLSVGHSSGYFFGDGNSLVKMNPFSIEEDCAFFSSLIAKLSGSAEKPEREPLRILSQASGTFYDPNGILSSLSYLMVTERALILVDSDGNTMSYALGTNDIGFNLRIKNLVITRSRYSIEVGNVYARNDDPNLQIGSESVPFKDGWFENLHSHSVFGAVFN